MSNRIPNGKLASLADYKIFFIELAKGLLAGKTHREIATHLNQQGIATSTGIAFNANGIDQILWRLRNPFKSRSSMYRAMTELFFQGELDSDVCLSLVSMRAVGQ